MTLPTAAMWFSLMSTASNKPMRWFSPPPQRTAYFCARRKPGQRLARVEDARARAGDELRVACASAVAVPDSVCRKFSAVRSPVTMLRAGPRNSQTIESAAICAPSAACQVDGDARVELAKRLVEPRAAAERRRLARDDARNGLRVRCR